MPQADVAGTMIEYESLGPEAAETVLFITGFGAQLTMWPADFIGRFIDRGYRTIVFDNRDAGLSQKFGSSTGVPAQESRGQASGLPVKVGYSLDDLAADAVGLLNVLGVRRAHIVGISMGGMIAQLMAADHPERVLSLSSIMSPPADPALPPSNPNFKGNPNELPASADLEQIIAHQVEVYESLSSPRNRTPRPLLQDQIARSARRSYYPEGISRQGSALTASLDRRAKLAAIRTPTLVLHGRDDPLLPVEAAYDIAGRIAGAELRVLPHWGHDLPPGLVATITDAVMANFHRASAGGA